MCFTDASMSAWGATGLWIVACAGVGPVYQRARANSGATDEVRVSPVTPRAPRAARHLRRSDKSHRQQLHEPLAEPPDEAPNTARAVRAREHQHLYTALAVRVELLGPPAISVPLTPARSISSDAQALLQCGCVSLIYLLDGNELHYRPPLVFFKPCVVPRPSLLGVWTLGSPHTAAALSRCLAPASSGIQRQVAPHIPHPLRQALRRPWLRITFNFRSTFEPGAQEFAGTRIHLGHQGTASQQRCMKSRISTWRKPCIDYPSDLSA